ncbi:uncharacterized protein B0H18DRAFT_316754 [Fomitopsis serialis]|uniref:uncharacterized protein n=1 Tax=Fomitopsis serialis TaxID=139415 RepID=UPI0020074542|nr:uncharacterized protein B0H18DRAFT_316754 [Neoantrodia serialis]KAH9936221.1 hypothetical protein B0H18DRAFT_316754 [Neoantrodia serialis]
MTDLDCGWCLLCGTCMSGCALLGSCMAIAFGCPTKVKPDKEYFARTCPVCDDAAVFPAESHHEMKCFFLPVASLRSKRIWVCETCDWQARMKENEAGLDTAVQYPEAVARPSRTTHQPSRSRVMSAPPNTTGRSSTHQPSRSRETNAPPNPAGRPSTHQPSRSRDTNAPSHADPRRSQHQASALQERDLPNPYEMSALPSNK